jgi:cobaltochelatase CobS
MNAPELTEDERLGLYLRSTGSGTESGTDGGTEWWRVSVADRPQTWRLEHGIEDAQGRSSIDIDLVVDAENLRAKLKKWHREGFVFEARGASPDADATQRADFMPALQRAVAAHREQAIAAKAHAALKLNVVRINDIEVPCGAAGPLVPRINPAYLFSARVNDVVADIVENRRVMLIGHTGAGKTSLIEQIAARSQHGVVRANMNGQTTVGDFVGFWTVKGGATLWVDGVLPTAMRDGLWLIVDEIDFAEPSILAALTAVLEPHGRLTLKEKGNEVVEPHPEFRLFATANAVGAMSQFRHLYQGANLMNEAFLDRWRVYLLDYLSPAEETDVLMRTLAPHMTRPLAATLAAIAADCRAAFAREDLSSAFSTRRLLDWAELMLRTGDPERAAGPAIYAKVGPEDATLIRGIIRHHIAPAG